MDFAAEPVLDAFTPPPPRAAGRNAPAPADANGQTFDDHLQAANEAAPERPAPAPRTTQREAPAEDGPVRAESEAAGDAVDPDTALLGGPLPTPALPPPMAAPVAVQIATAEAAPPQAQQALDAAAPMTAPQAPAAPQQPKAASVEQTAVRDDVAVAATPASGKSAPAEVKQATPDAPQTQTTANTQSAPAQSTAPQSDTPAAPTPIAAPALPPSVRETLAATIAPVQQTSAPTTQRAAKSAAQPIEGKSAPEVKTDAPAADAKTQPPKANAAAPNVTMDAAPAAQASMATADASQVTQDLGVATTISQASSHAQHAAAETGTQRAAPAAAQVGREIIRRFDGGNTSFELRLDPPELGRVEVRMEVSRDHKVTAVISADNPQALAEMARHARDLEQQLQSAGLELGENGLSFDLRQGREGGDAEQSTQGRGGGEGAPAEQQQAQTARPLGLERWRGVRVDISV